jgi:hypothetical protein
MYEVGRPTGRCAATGREIAPGVRFVAVLLEPEPGGPLVRRDYIESEWEQGVRPPPAEVFAAWRMTMPEPGKRSSPLIGNEELLDLFMQMGDRQGERAAAFRYLLALILLRKRLLRSEGPGGQGVLRVRVATRASEEPGPVIEVADPQLDDSRIVEAMEEIGAVMAGDGA